MSLALRSKLARLESMGGEVDEEEVAYQLGAEAVLELFEAAEEGLVVTRTTFEVTDKGRELLAERSAT